jgi:sugar phosphate isomerase/epimerase
LTAPISVQLYSLRDACAIDFDQVLADVARIGYQGVEPANLYGMAPRQFRARVGELGMQVSSSHYPWATRADTSEVIDVLGELGLTRAIGGYFPDDFADRAAIERTAAHANGVAERLAGAGIGLALHNHWWEFAPIEGAAGYHLLQQLAPEIEFEIDTYWAANFGRCDPAAEVARVRDRTPLLHIKDGPLVQGEPHVACGLGMIDIAAVVAAADPEVLEWLVVELDACASDMLAAIEASYTWLTGHGLATGRR